jgi:methyl-accepting chemotaxis protein
LSVPPPRTLGFVTRTITAVHQSMVAEEVAGLLRRRPPHSAVPVIDSEGHAVGLVSRERLLAEIAHVRRCGRPITELMDPYPLCLDEATSLTVALRRASSRDENHLYDPLIVEQNGRYLGVVTMHALMRAIADGSAT